MSNKALAELTQAESLLSNWRYLPGSQIKVLASHLIRALDEVASQLMGEETLLERVYLVLSGIRLFNEESMEHSFYDTYFFLKNLLDKDIQRLNPDLVRISGYKQVENADREYFESLINEVRSVVSEVFN